MVRRIFTLTIEKVDETDGLRKECIYRFDGQAYMGYINGSLISDPVNSNIESILRYGLHLLNQAHKSSHKELPSEVSLTYVFDHETYPVK